MYKKSAQPAARERSQGTLEEVKRVPITSVEVNRSPTELCRSVFARALCVDPSALARSLYTGPCPCSPLLALAAQTDRLDVLFTETTELESIGTLTPTL